MNLELSYTCKLTFIPFLNRYVDDFSLIISKDKIDIIVQTINPCEPITQFTVEKETNKEINFFELKQSKYTEGNKDKMIQKSNSFTTIPSFLLISSNIMKY